MTNDDLFPDSIAVQLPHGKYGKYIKPKGYAWSPGTGPPRETCKTCKHRVVVNTGSGIYSKCDLVKRNWTKSRRTDILVKSPACKYWEAVGSNDP